MYLFLWLPLVWNKLEWGLCIMIVSMVTYLIQQMETPCKRQLWNSLQDDMHGDPCVKRSGSQGGGGAGGG